MPTTTVVAFVAIEFDPLPIPDMERSHDRCLLAPVLHFSQACVRAPGGFVEPGGEFGYSFREKPLIFTAILEGILMLLFGGILMLPFGHKTRPPKKPLALYRRNT